MLKFRVGSAVRLVLSEPGLKENGSSTSRHVVQIAINSGLGFHAGYCCGYMSTRN